ncbi:transcriptional regulator, AsnC family [mine drainage metagenome]|uniref:Transcriptional regulator, AsnC family n=1 Tax=mine drainage metagenome TaxID=410659 RepID=T0ZUG7_9ZZZZ
MRYRSKALPEPVAETLERMNRNRERKITVGMVKGRYYTFDTKTVYSEEKGRNITVTLYLGKIESDGKFIPARHKKGLTNVNTVTELINEMKKSPIDEFLHPSKIDNDILEMLSADGRVATSKIAEETRLSSSAIAYRIKRLEKKYGIRYTLEFGPRPFNFFRFVVFVRFLHHVPQVKDMQELLEREPTIQFAALVKGKYDLFMYIMAENTHDLEGKVYNIRTNRVFSAYKSFWSVSYVTYAYGYVPLRKEFIELLKDKVWHRTKETPRRKPDWILERDYLILKELNENGRESFADMDNKLGLKSGASDYTYYKLVNDKVIYRVTINMLSLPMKYTLLMRCPQVNISSFDVHRDEYRSHVIERTDTPTNRYILIGDIGAPYGLLHIKPIYNERMEDAVDELKRYTREDRVETHVITDVLVGSLGFRKIPKEITYQYKALVKRQQQDNKESDN